MASYDHTFKIIVLGDADIPKSPFTKRYCYNLFDPSESLTIGVDFHVKPIELHGKKIKLQSWDFGGEERFRFLLPTYLRKVNAAILLYNITNPNTLEHLPDWIRIVREKTGDIPIILVGAKAHLEEFRAVSREEGILAVKKYNLSGFIEVSSKTGQNVKKAFELIIAKSLEKYSTGITKTSKNRSRTEREKYLKGCPVCGSSKIKKNLRQYSSLGATPGPFSYTMEEVYEVESTGKLTILDIKPEELQNYLKPNRELIIIRRDLKKIYIWTGSKSPVWKSFISSRVAQDLQRDRYHKYDMELMKQYEEFRCRHCGYVWYKELSKYVC